MLQHEFVAQIKSVQDALNAAPTLFECIRIVTDVERVIQADVAKIAEAPKQDFASAIHNRYATLNNNFGKVEIHELFDESRDLVGALKATEAPYATSLISSIEAFRGQFSKFLRAPNSKEARELASAAIRVSVTRELLVATLSAMSGELSVPPSSDDVERAFQLWLRADDDYDSFVEKLGFLKEIYDKLCELLNVSMSDNPLVIRKIESGSLWVDLLGNAAVIGLMTCLVKESVQYLHRRYTTEGKIASLNTTRESMDKLFDFTKKIEAAGIDTSESQEELRAGAALIAKNLNRLLRGQANVVVNGETLRLHSRQEPLFLEEAKTLKIGYTADE